MSSRDPAAKDAVEVWRELERFCLAVAERALAAMGLRTVGPDRMRDVWPAVSEATGHWVADRGTPVELDTDPSGLFEMEQLSLRQPRPARVRDLAACHPGDLVSGSAPLRHIFLTVRQPAVLRRQFALQNDPWSPARTEPVVAVQVRRPDGDGVDIYPLESPARLETAARPDTDLGLLASVALTCARDRTWSNVWQTPLLQSASTAILLDTPFSQSIAAILADKGDFRYGLTDVVEGSRHLCVFACAIGDYPPFLAPCTPTGGAGLMEHVTRRTGGKSAVDLTTLTSDPKAMRVIIDHLVSDESVVETSTQSSIPGAVRSHSDPCYPS
ncbi:MAG: hypothetical protein ACRDTC_02765 [Pseudonocardiaceae bacterium]